MGVDSSNNLVQACKIQPFSISTDVSNDQTDKNFPLVITYVPSDLEMRTKLLSLLKLKKSLLGKTLLQWLTLSLLPKTSPGEIVININIKHKKCRLA